MANKLELTWVGKDQKIDVEPRILLERESLNYSKEPEGLIKKEGLTYDNLLIHGDNLLALKALEKDYTGRVKCVYIDPPYNTGSAFEHYDDNLEHSQWLNLMRPRLEILKKLLSEDGSIWISIDDDEGHYLKVLCDEIFGRNNFVSTVIWEKKYSPQNDAKWLSDNHDFILVYAKSKEIWRPNLLPRSDKANELYKYDNHDGRGPWKSGDVLVKSFSESGVFPIRNPNTGEEFYPPKGSCYRFNRETAQRYLEENRFYFGKDGKGKPQLKRYLSEVKQGLVTKTIWFRDEVGDNQEAKTEIKKLDFPSVFVTPKPERLIERILLLASNAGDLVLDSFLGSGTTAAVAHKMKRRWIGIEMGDHAYTHCKTRLDKVISGEDKGGITKSANWIEGGGYKFYELAPTLIKTDAFGQEIINPEYNPEMLAAAVAFHEGYTFSQNPDSYWKQSFNGTSSYLFVTTNHVNRQMVDSILTEMKEDEFLLIVAKSFDANCLDGVRNVAIKKIPQSLLKNCEFGRDDYSLNIVCPPKYEDEE